MPWRPSGWDWTAPESHIRLGDDLEPAFLSQGVRLAIDVSLVAGQCRVEYALGKREPGAAYGTKALSTNPPKLQKGTGYTYLELKYYVEKTSSSLTTIYTPAANTGNPTSEWAVTGQEDRVYWSEETLPPALPGRAIIDVRRGGGLLEVHYGRRGPQAGVLIQAVIDTGLSTDFDTDALMVVYRIYRASWPTASVSIITPGGEPEGPHVSP